MPRKSTVTTPPNPSGKCMCGCGGDAPIAPYSRASREWLNGHAVKYIPGHHRRKWNTDDIAYLVDDETGCWVWQRTIQVQGYGVIRINKTNVRAHRYYFAQKHGDIPEGIDLHHVCANKACVNPDHLLPVSHSEHVRLEWAINPERNMASKSNR